MSIHSSREEPLALPLARQVDALCCRFEADWKAAAAGAERPRLETYLSDLKEPHRVYLVQELLAIEVHHRRQAGEKPWVSEYQERFPELGPNQMAQIFAPDPVGAAVDPGLPLTDGHPANARSPGGDTLLRWSHLPQHGDKWVERPAVPGYEVLGILGRGGMGIVYKARQVKLNRIVALKMILAGGHAGPRALHRFSREAAAVAQLQHPQIVQIYEIGEHAGRPYLVLEFVDGRSLDKHLAGTPQPAQAAAELVESLARAVHSAHQSGVVHRDLKPANILLPRTVKETTERSNLVTLSPCHLVTLSPKITDFGLAKLMGDDDSGGTGSGDVLGTPSYMAPEQAGGKTGTAGPATDVYGLGAILYELVTGRPPFKAETALETLFQVRFAEPVSPSRLQPKCPGDLVTITLKCLHKEPRKRYDSAAALAEDLRRFQSGEPIQARPVGPTERVVKWVQRHPATASLLGLVLLLAVLGFTGVSWYALRAEEGRREAELAQHAAQEAREEAQAALYSQRVGRAFREWQACDVEQAEQQLRPYATEGRQSWEWSYVRGLCHSSLLTLTGHTGHVSSLAFSPDGRWLASATGAWDGNQPGEIKLWDAATGDLLRTFAGHMAPVFGLAFHPNGRQLASAGVSWATPLPGGVKLWDVDTGKETGALLDGSADAFAVAFSPDGRTLATAGRDGSVRIWDSTTRKEVVTLGQHPDNVFAVVFSPDGRTLASGSRDKTVRIWDLATHQQLHRLEAGSDVRSVAFSPDGRYLAVGTWGQTVQVWDTAKATLLITHHVHSTPIYKVAFRPDGLWLASADRQGLIQFHDVLRISETHSVRGHNGGVLSLTYSPDGARLATGGRDGQVRIWDTLRDQEFRGLRRAMPWINALAYSPDSRHLAMGGTYNGSRLATLNEGPVWDVEYGTVQHVLRGHTAGIASVAYSPDGTRLATGSPDQTVRLWEAVTGKLLTTLKGHTKNVTTVAFDPAGERLASASSDQTVRLWDVRSGQEIQQLSAHTRPITYLAFSPDGRYLASAAQDGCVMLWNATTAQFVRSLPAHETAVWAIAFSPDGVWLASAGKDKTVALWNVATGREQFRCRGHSQAVTCVAFSPDGRRLASGSRDWSVKLWDVRSGEETFTLRGYQGEVFSVAFSPDGRQLAAGGNDEIRVKIWEVELSQKQRADRLARAVLPWHRRAVTANRNAKQWYAAAFHLTQLLIAQPGQANLLSQRGDALAELGRWDEADADFRELIKRGNAPSLAFYSHAVLRLRAGDSEGYRTTCQELLKAYEKTPNRININNVAWVHALAPQAGVDYAQVVALAEQSVAKTPDYSHLNTLGTVLYRAGRFAEAVQRLDQALAIQGKGGDVEDWLVLAMAHQGLNDPAQARSWLDKAIKALDAAAAAETAPVVEWHNRLERQLFRAEAETLIPEAKP